MAPHLCLCVHAERLDVAGACQVQSSYVQMAGNNLLQALNGLEAARGWGHLLQTPVPACAQQLAAQCRQAEFTLHNVRGHMAAADASMQAVEAAAQLAAAAAAAADGTGSAAPVPAALAAGGDEWGEELHDLAVEEGEGDGVGEVEDDFQVVERKGRKGGGRGKGRGANGAGRR